MAYGVQRLRKPSSCLDEPLSNIVIDGVQDLDGYIRYSELPFAFNCWPNKFHLAQTLTSCLQTLSKTLSSEFKLNVVGNDFFFSQATIPDVDMARLVYFALSVFWRGTRRWSAVDGGRPPRLYLGRHERAIRAFLLGRGKLPDDIVTTVAAWPYKNVYRMALMPRALPRPGYLGYRFYFFGFIFELALGRKIPAVRRRTCSYHSPEKFLTLSLELGSVVKEAIHTQLQSMDRSKIEGMLKEIEAIRSQEGR